MTSIYTKSRTCAVHGSAEDGYEVHMIMPDGKPLAFEMSLHDAAFLNAQISRAIGNMVKPPPEGPPQKYFQK